MWSSSYTTRWVYLYTRDHLHQILPYKYSYVRQQCWCSLHSRHSHGSPWCIHRHLHCKRLTKNFRWTCCDSQREVLEYFHFKQKKIDKIKTQVTLKRTQKSTWKLIVSNLPSRCRSKPKLSFHWQLDPASTCCLWCLCLHLPLFPDKNVLGAAEWNPEALDQKRNGKTPLPRELHGIESGKIE